MGTEIWMAVLVVAGVGLICGIVIAVASRLMGVQEDEKSKALRDCLPGANCGACGYTGCDGYAKALSLGECTKTNLCVPGADATAVKIAAILGVAAEDVVEKVAVIACNGSCGVTEKRNRIMREWRAVRRPNCFSEAMEPAPMDALAMAIARRFARTEPFVWRTEWQGLIRVFALAVACALPLARTI